VLSVEYLAQGVPPNDHRPPPTPGVGSESGVR